MAETPVEQLERWEDSGALWRAVHVSDDYAIVDLCECTGQPVERLESSDPELIRYLRERPAGGAGA